MLSQAIEHDKSYIASGPGWIQRGEGGGRESGPPWKITKNIGVLSNTCTDPLENHKATKPALNVGPSSVRQRNAI